MCGRYVLAGGPDDYLEFLRADRLLPGEPLAPSYNVAPTDPVYAAVASGEERLLIGMRWGLVPSWDREGRSIHINARVETVAEKPAFRTAVSRSRCLIPADGFYEWEPKERGGRPYWVQRDDGSAMAFAGLWARRVDPVTGERRETCAILTTAARGPITAVHDRMPLALDPAMWEAWLDPDLTDPDEARAVLMPADPDQVHLHPVSTEVNSVRNDHPGLTRPLDQPRLW